MYMIDLLLPVHCMELPHQAEIQDFLRCIKGENSENSESGH